MNNASNLGRFSVSKIGQLFPPATKFRKKLDLPPKKKKKKKALRCSSL
jgi:hypothetical protein